MIIRFLKGVRPSVTRPCVKLMNINNRDLRLEGDMLIQTKQRDKAVK